MNYICGDRGTEHCPCHLMEAGRCYTCTMISSGCCSCEDKAGWQGVCPYAEYIQQGGMMQAGPWDQLSAFRILSKTDFTAGLSVIRVEAQPGLAGRCSRIGTYMMAGALGWRTPLSVLRCSRSGWLEFLVKETGSKTRELMRQAEDSGGWQLAGPYGSGLPGSEQLTGFPELVIARGVAAAPLIHMLNEAELPEKCISYLDDEGLPEPFLQEYLGDMPYNRVCLRERETQELLRGHICRKTGEGKPVLALVSPYYADLLCGGLSEEQKVLVIRPNPANLCCAMGLCGSCSHTDKDGVTVKLCKCSQTVIK